jgi:TonB family protein
LGIGDNSTRPFEEGEARVKVTKLVAILNAVCTLVFFLAGSEAQEKKTAVSPGMSAACQILTPTGGVDFSDNMKDLLVRLKRNWFTVMPEDAQLGKKGRVVVRFQIQKDGTLLVKEPTVELSSKDAQLDKAATAAIRTSAPFKPLPDAFQGPSIDLRFLFNYNVPYPMPPQNSGGSPH